MPVDMQGKRVMVTGGAGFLGRHVVAELATRDPEEIIVPRSAEWDLVDARATDALFAETRPDVVIHLAAEVGGIGANKARPGRYFYANMSMGLNVTESSRVHGVTRLVQIGTVCAYPKFTPVPFKESDLFNGYPEETNAPYGVAKRAMYVMGRAYRDEYGLDVIHVLPVNLYGPEDDFDLETSHVIPALIRKFHQAREDKAATVEVWGDGSASREFLYVDDAVRGIVRATERYDGVEPLNIGAGHEITIRSLVDLIREVTGFEGGITWDTSKPNGQPRRMLDVSRAREEIGFVAEMPLREGLKRTYDWWVAAV